LNQPIGGYGNLQSLGLIAAGQPVLPSIVPQEQIGEAYGLLREVGKRVAVPPPLDPHGNRKRLAVVVGFILSDAGIPLPKSVSKRGGQSKYEAVMQLLLHASGDGANKNLFRLLKYGADRVRQIRADAAPPLGRKPDLRTRRMKS
jgi:hypothetical protein